MDKCSISLVPIQKGYKFSLMQCPKNYLERKQMENIPYASIIGSLMYAQTYHQILVLLLVCLVDTRVIQDRIIGKLQSFKIPTRNEGSHAYL